MDGSTGTDASLLEVRACGKRSKNCERRSVRVSMAEREEDSILFFGYTGFEVK